MATLSSSLKSNNSFAVKRATAITLAVGFTLATGASAALAVAIFHGPAPTPITDLAAPKIETVVDHAFAPAGERSPVVAWSAATWQPSPTSILPLKILDYPHFRIGYDEQAKNPAWVAYQLTGPITATGQEQRPSTFATEFRTAAHVAHRDYSNSGFDRGHMCPAYAMFSRYGEACIRRCKMRPRNRSPWPAVAE